MTKYQWLLALPSLAFSSTSVSVVLIECAVLRTHEEGPMRNYSGGAGGGVGGGAARVGKKSKLSVEERKD